MIHKTRTRTHQSGVVMVIALIMLLLLTMIGITASQVTSLEEKMAGNSRDQNIAFQAAEAALRDGENLIETFDKISDFDTSIAGMYGKADPMPNYHTTSWDNSDSVAYSATIPLVASQPRLYVKYIGEGNSQIANMLDPTQGGGEGAVHWFSITARGTGRQDSSQVFLQSHYAIQLQ